MKTNFLSIFRPLLYIFIGLSLVFACQQINPLDEVELTVSSAVTKSPVLIHFANANSTSTNQPSDFAVSISVKMPVLYKWTAKVQTFRLHMACYRYI